MVVQSDLRLFFIYTTSYVKSLQGAMDVRPGVIVKNVPLYFFVPVNTENTVSVSPYNVLTLSSTISPSFIRIRRSA